VVKPPAARLTLIVPPELASGFRIVGAEVEVSTDAPAIHASLDTLLNEGEPGIIGVYAPYFAALPAAIRDRCERATQPVVIPLPTGQGAGDGATHRARIAALLERAVGYHITFADEAG
jgi:vacuolar-type H+-ATPase subunit F/Vma7